MESIYIFSGTVGFLLVSLFGVTHTLKCITCEWSADQDHGNTSCISTPYKEYSEQCGQPVGNIKYICQTKLEYKTVAEKYYLSSVSRMCQLEHGDCDIMCHPKAECFRCCSANNNCNSMPLTSAILSPEVSNNVTNGSPQEILRTKYSLFTHFIFIISFHVSV